MKTIKQIADDLGVSKQIVSRYVSKTFQNVSREANRILLNDQQEQQIKEHFSRRKNVSKNDSKSYQTVSDDTILMQSISRQLEEKDRQIETLQKLLDQEQQLHMATKQEVARLLEAPKREENRGSFWSRLFRGRKEE